MNRYLKMFVLSLLTLSGQCFAAALSSPEESSGAASATQAIAVVRGYTLDVHLSASPGFEAADMRVILDENAPATVTITSETTKNKTRYAFTVGRLTFEQMPPELSGQTNMVFVKLSAENIGNDGSKVLTHDTTLVVPLNTESAMSISSDKEKAQQVAVLVTETVSLKRWIQANSSKLSATSACSDSDASYDTQDARKVMSCCAYGTICGQGYLVCGSCIQVNCGGTVHTICMSCV